MAKTNLRGFVGYRKDMTVLVEKTVKTSQPVIDKKGRPVIENGKPKMIVTEERVKFNPVKPFVIRTNNGVPPSHRMLH